MVKVVVGVKIRKIMVIMEARIGMSVVMKNVKIL